MHKLNFIDGQWFGGGSALPLINPSNTLDVIAEYGHADHAQAEAAFAADRRGAKTLPP